MSRPGILIGGETSLLRSSNTTEITAESSTGVFAKHPGSTPKHALHKRGRDAESKDSMARLFVELPPGDDVLTKFLESLPKDTRPLGKLLATGGGLAGSAGTGFIDFLMTQASEDFREKAQIVDTLTDNYVAFYTGQEPPLFQYGGTVLNTYQDDQRVWLMRLYRDILRGTRLANRGLVARLRYDSFIVSGYMENLLLGITGDAENYGSFQFSMRVKNLVVFTESVGLPTLVETPASSFSLNTLKTSVGDVSRAATLMTETPATSLTGPSADSERETNRILDALAGASAAAEHQLALDRLTAAGTSSNASNDGSGGITNVLNPDESLVDQAADTLERVGSRLKGVLGIPPEGATIASL